MDSRTISFYCDVVEANIVYYFGVTLGDIHKFFDFYDEVLVIDSPIRKRIYVSDGDNGTYVTRGSKSVNLEQSKLLKLENFLTHIGFLSKRRTYKEYENEFQKFGGAYYASDDRYVYVMGNVEIFWCYPKCI